MVVENLQDILTDCVKEPERVNSQHKSRSAREEDGAPPPLPILLRIEIEPKPARTKMTYYRRAQPQSSHGKL